VRRTAGVAVPVVNEAPVDLATLGATVPPCFATAARPPRSLGLRSIVMSESRACA
jgi:hypothetical protein